MSESDKSLGENLRVCKRCLLFEANEQEYQEKIARILNAMKPYEKAESKCVEARLLLCKECEKLNRGTCVACGCFVELRSALKDGHCPYKKW